MNARRAIARAAFLAALVLFCGVTATVLTGSNTVPSSKAGSSASSLGVNDVKPSACSSITIGARQSGSGVIAGTTGNDLILGSSGNDTISGSLGNDCILGGGGTDSIDGGVGTDVCIGHTGDTYLNCETIVNQ